MPVPQRYLNMKEAAAFLGYSRDYFARLVREYRIPAKGPAGKRFDTLDLEVFMDDPNCFLNQEPATKGRAPGKFTPLAL